MRPIEFSRRKVRSIYGLHPSLTLRTQISLPKLSPSLELCLPCTFHLVGFTLECLESFKAMNSVFMSQHSCAFRIRTVAILALFPLLTLCSASGTLRWDYYANYKVRIRGLSPERMVSASDDCATRRECPRPDDEQWALWSEWRANGSTRARWRSSRSSPPSAVGHIWHQFLGRRQRIRAGLRRWVPNFGCCFSPYALAFLLSNGYWGFNAENSGSPDILHGRKLSKYPTETIFPKASGLTTC